MQVTAGENSKADGKTEQEVGKNNVFTKSFKIEHDGGRWWGLVCFLGSQDAAQKDPEGGKEESAEVAGEGEPTYVKVGQVDQICAIHMCDARCHWSHTMFE